MQRYAGRTRVNARETEPRQEIGSVFKKRRREDRNGGGESRLFVDSFIPLKFNPDILLGTDLNNVAGNGDGRENARCIPFCFLSPSPFLPL